MTKVAISSWISPPKKMMPIARRFEVDGVARSTVILLDDDPDERHGMASANPEPPGWNRGYSSRPALAGSPLNPRPRRHAQTLRLCDDEPRSRSFDDFSPRGQEFKRFLANLHLEADVRPRSYG